MSNNQTNIKDGPNFIGYYRHLFSLEISEIEEQLLFSKSVPFFTDSLGGGLSNCKKARLRSILHEAATVLNKEVDELLEKIIAKLEAESDLGQSACFSENSNEDSTQEASVTRKRKMPAGPDFSHRVNGFHSSELFKKVYKKCVDGNGKMCKEAVDQYSTDILQKLCMMEQGIEEFINEIVVNCRAMTSAEKQQLGGRIQKLPEKAYDLLIEIFQSRNPFSRQNSDSVCVNLEKQDDATLWRLYYYVETVLRASVT